MSLPRPVIPLRGRRKPARRGGPVGTGPGRYEGRAETARTTTTGFPLPPTFPPVLEQRLEQLAAEGEGEILLSAPFDLTPDGRFCSGWVLATGRFLWVVREGEVVREVDLGRAANFKAATLVGAGEFTAEIDGEPVRLAAYTARHLAYFSRLEQYLNQLAGGRRPARIEPPPARVCSRCGRVLPEGVSLCPFCVDKWSVFRRLLGVARPHARLFAFGLLTFWLVTGLRLLLPQLYRILIDDVLRAGSASFGPGGAGAVSTVPAAGPAVTGATTGAVTGAAISAATGVAGAAGATVTGAGGLIGQLVLYVALIGLLNLLTQLASILWGRIMNTMGVRLARDLRELVYAKIQALSLNYLSQQKTGDLMNRVTGDTGTIQQFIQNHAGMIVSNTLLFLGVVVILFAVHWRLALLVLLPAPVVVFWSARVRHTIHRMYHRQWRAWDRTNSLLQNILSGIRVVKAFGQEAKEVRRFTERSAEMRDITANNEKTWNTLFPTLGFIIGLGQFIILYYGGHLVLQRELHLGELVQFSSYAAMIYGPLQFVSFIPRWFTEAMTAAERIFQVIDQEPQVKEAAKPVHRRIEGRVELLGVTFGYEAHHPVLRDITFTVEPGEMIGIVGHSGAGKSTLINLICRFYDPDEGEIRIDGVNLKDFAQASLRSQIGVVLQETFLFSGTILENIAYAKPDATLEEVIRAAKIANAHDFIIRFPNGYDTRVGERGQLLSVGERQRIAIARAVLRDPRLLILDEATASVDSETEMQIQQALARLVKNRTTFVIAHRLSTLRNANRVVVLEKGRLAEMGTHEELIQKRGIYYNLVMAQLRLSRIKGY